MGRRIRLGRHRLIQWPGSSLDQDLAVTADLGDAINPKCDRIGPPGSKRRDCDSHVKVQFRPALNCGGEINEASGRHHWGGAFTSLLAGGGVKGGITHGETNEFGSEIAENGVHVHDYHATILHLMGIDHTRLTYRYGGRDFRLTDVHGNVVHDILA